jgi:hypothetical protein
MARLDTFVRAVETRLEPAADFDAILDHERTISPALDGRTAFGDRARTPRPRSRQLGLFDR